MPRLEAAVASIDENAAPEGVSRLKTELLTAEARVEALEKEISDIEADEAKAAEQAKRADRNALRSIYNEHGGDVSSLPEALRSRVLEQRERDSLAKLMRNRPRPF